MTEDQIVSSAATTLMRINHTLVIRVPSSMVASLEGITKQKVSDSNRYFGAMMKITLDGRIIVTDIIERQKVEKTKETKGQGRR